MRGITSRTGQHKTYQILLQNSIGKSLSETKRCRLRRCIVLCHYCLLLAGADSSSGSSPQRQYSGTEYSSL